MATSDLISDIRQSLKMSYDVEEATKLQGLDKLSAILSKHDPQLDEYGYVGVIFRELIKLLKSESGEVFRKVTDLLSNFYSTNEKYQDDLMESLIYRCSLSNDTDISLECLQSIASLIDRMDDNVAKHSKKLLKLSDLYSTASMKPTIIEILEKLKKRLPTRKSLLEIVP